MNYADIKNVDIQDGTGVRVSIYVSGCHFHCKGCHNQEAWDFNYGKEFTDETIDYIMDLLDHEYIAGLSILGGEPMELVNQKGLLPLIKKVKSKFPEKNIWCYTGYDFEKDIYQDMYKKYDYTKEFVDNIDIMVDGEFIEEKTMADLKFRGSTNQRKIDVKASLKAGKAVALKFGDEDRYEEKVEAEKKPKILFYQEFEKKAEKENVQENMVIPGFDDNKIVSITPAFEIQEAEEKIAAETNIKKEDNKL